MPRINMYQLYRQDNRLLDKALSLELEHQKQLNRRKYKALFNKFSILAFLIVVTLFSSLITYN